MVGNHLFLNLDYRTIQKIAFTVDYYSKAIRAILYYCDKGDKQNRIGKKKCLKQENKSTIIENKNNMHFSSIQDISERSE
jgi:hypothetical protein